MYFLHRYPFLRLLLFLAAGIYVGDEFFFRGWNVSADGLLFALLTLPPLLLASYFLKQHTLRWVFGVLLLTLCFVGGMVRSTLPLQQSTVNFPQAEAVYHVRITDQPEQKERSILCQAALEQKSILLYLLRDSLSEQLQSGDELLLSTRLSMPVPNGNPDEFDYPRYLTRKQISATGFCSAENWTLLSHKATPTLRQQALAWRGRILSLYRSLGFSEDDFAVLSALTVGYKEELSEEIRETYSISGASHVLALSGLHIGFLYALLLFCLKALPGKGQGVRIFRSAIILLLLWAFAFFTGLSASVVRSVIMCSLFALSGAFGRDSISLNTLLTAAFFMLLCQPAWLFDVGFQLSFCAVAAILLIQPALYRLLPATNRFSRYLWGLMSVSIAAQIGTAPIVILYFSRFSTHFLLTNLMVIPLVSIIMYASVILLLFTPFPLLQSGMAFLVKGLVQALNSSVRWVEQLPWASVDNLWIYPLEIFAFYLLLFLLPRQHKVHIAKSLITYLLYLFCFCAFHLAMLINDRPHQSMVFYNVRGCPAVHCIAADGRSWLTYADSLPEEKRLRQTLSRHWRHLHLAEPKAVTTNYKEDTFRFQGSLLSYAGRRVCLVSDNRWRKKRAAHPLPVDYLYLCKGYNGALKELTGLFRFNTVILDSSLSDYRREALGKECRLLGFHYISLANEGSVCFLL